MISQNHGLPELCQIPPSCLEIRNTQISGKQQEPRVTDFNCYPHKKFPVIELFYYKLYCATPIHLMYSRSQSASTHSTAHDATVGERSRKQKKLTYAPAQDH